MKQNHIANGGFTLENTEEQEGYTDQAVEERAGSFARDRSDPDGSNPGKAIKIGSFHSSFETSYESRMLMLMNA